MSVAATLQRCRLFGGFTGTGIAILASIARERRLPAGAPLFDEGQPGASLFVVRSGTLRIVQGGRDGERELARVGEGEHLGALSLLAPGVRQVSAIAATDCELLELSAAEFAALGPEKPKACLKLALAIAADVARTAGEARDLIRRAAAEAGG